MSDLLIKNGLVFTCIHEEYHALKLRETDILIENGWISKINPAIEASCEILDATGCLVLPGYINMGSASISSRLLSGLLADRKNTRQQRLLPVLDLASNILCAEDIYAIATLSLWDGLSGGTTTAVEYCRHSFSKAIQNASEELGMRLLIAPGEKDLSEMILETEPEEQLTDQILKNLTAPVCITGTAFTEPRLGPYTAISSIGCVQEGNSYPGLEYLRKGINTPLMTGYSGNCMINEMRTAAFSAKQSEKNPAQFKAADAFYAATAAGARALGCRDILGRVDIGLSGDFSLIDMERFQPLSYPFTQFLYSGTIGDVRHVVCKGSICKKDFKPAARIASGLDFAKRKAHQAVSKVWDEAIRTIF